MKLQLLHGRKTPDEKLTDWGFNGPCIEGIAALHVTYYATFVAHFKDKASAEAAQRLTGWDWFDADALELRRERNLIHVRARYILQGPTPGPAAYYGDWELQEDSQ
ncbi:MAG: hypothetical protein ABSC63_14520 [Candidatus Binataceae bacterium]|jgi:hypothetical protein